MYKNEETSVAHTVFQSGLFDDVVLMQLQVSGCCFILFNGLQNFPVSGSCD